MAEKIGIVGVAQTKYEASKPGWREGELVFEVVDKVRQETGLKFEEGTGIDTTVTCSSDHWDGVTISSWMVAGFAGGHKRAEQKVSEDGALAAYYGFIEIMSGHADIVLVVAHTKESQTSKNIIENYGFDPIYQRMLGIDFVSAGALQASQYMQKYGITPEQCAKVVVKSRQNARLNPFAQATKEVTIEEVLKSPMLASPIHKLDAKPTSDGACAMILAKESKAKKITDKPVWIKGIGSCYDAHYLGDRDLTQCESLSRAAKMAYKMGGINDPGKQIDLAEISAEFSYQELLWAEGLGLCERGEGGNMLDAGLTERGGELAINPSGGTLNGNPTNVAGLTRVAEAALQLQGKANGHQVGGVKTALAHGMAGPCGQLNCVLVLGT